MELALRQVDAVADALVVVATAVYEARRLTDDRLNAVLESAGFTLPRPTA